MVPSSNRSRTPPFQGGNRGSSPRGITKGTLSKRSVSMAKMGYLIHLRGATLRVRHIIRW